MILTLSKEALLSAMIFQAKKDVRYYLNGICFAPDKKLFATDGHRLFIGEHDRCGPLLGGFSVRTGLLSIGVRNEKRVHPRVFTLPYRKSSAN